MADKTLSGFGEAPSSGRDEADADVSRERCQTERETLTPRETAECAGSGLAEQYENEEDGGS